MTIYSCSLKVFNTLAAHRRPSFARLLSVKKIRVTPFHMMNTSTESRGVLLSGTEVSRDLVKKLNAEVSQLAKLVPGFRPGLAIVQVGNREDSNVYIKMKLKTAADIGIDAEHIKLPPTTTQIQLINKLKELNQNPKIHGIIVQMPLDSTSKIDSDLITDLVAPEKDVDGLNTINEGRAAIGNREGFIPCTPNGVMELIKRSGIKIEGTEAVVLGRSKIVGTPAAELLKWANSTVTVCHSKTKNLPDVVSRADILVVGIGKPQFVKGSWIKNGAVVIDCGINSIPDSTKKSGKRLVGDVDFEEAKKVASFITPVPGGVGPMTVAMLMNNTVISARRAVDKMVNTKWAFSPLPINPQKPVPSDIEIAHSQTPKDIIDLAQEMGILTGEVIPYGHKMAKLSLSVTDRLKNQKNGTYVVVAGITPTSLGEGKSTTTLGLVQALTAQKNINSIACVRQPSQGPTFGIKGGAAGGGYSQIIPMEDFNLHLTGDIHAVTAANNLLAAQIDARILHEASQKDTALYSRLVPTSGGKRQFTECQLRRLQKLGIQTTVPDELTPEEISAFVRLNIDPASISWTRVLDVNDRFLRKITIGQGNLEKNLTRETSFSISVASEIMAILALANNMSDLKERLSKIVVAKDRRNCPITADDLGATGAMAVLLKDAIQPTLMQSLEGTPVLVHAGPFANIAHGCSSIIADAMALKLVGPDGIVVTEAGFGSDIGMEKFFGIKCHYSHLIPDVVVLVTTIRALKMHGGAPDPPAKGPLPKEYTMENLDFLKAGLPNLLKHISNGRKFGIPVIVALNHFSTDKNSECELVLRESIANGAFDAVICKHWELGGEGALDLVDAVQRAQAIPNEFRLLYNVDDLIEKKIETIAKEMYGAQSVTIPPAIKEKIDWICDQGFGSLPICMSKTALSLSGDPTIRGVPTNFDLPITDVYVSVGAGFIVVMVGEISKMPGLPTRPAIYDIDYNCISDTIEGLF